MTRMSKQQRRRAVSPRKHKAPAVKTGPKKDALPRGFREHENAAPSELAQKIFIPKVN